MHPMSTETPSNPEEPAKTRPKKAVKSDKARKAKSADPAPEETVLIKQEAPTFPVFDLTEPEPTPSELSSAEEPAPTQDWPEPEAASSSQSPSSENHKRKRRRKKGKGGQSNQPQVIPNEETIPLVAQDPSSPAAAQRQSPPRPKLDQEMIAKLSWKIFLAEVSEEGVALIGDNDARELSRRCFRLAEIFIEEQSRRRQ